MNSAINNIYTNDGSGSFTKVEGSAISANMMNSRAGCFADYDGDGDLVRLHEGLDAQRPLPLSRSHVQVTITCFASTHHNNMSMSVRVQDIFISNSFAGAPKELYVNNGAGIYTSTVWGTYSTSIYDGWGILLADLDSNGMLDIVTFNVGQPGSNLAQGNAVEQYMVKRRPTRSVNQAQTDAINSALTAQSSLLTSSATVCGLPISSYNTSIREFDNDEFGWPNSVKRYHSNYAGIDALQQAGGFAEYVAHADVHLVLNGAIPGVSFADINSDGALDMVVATQSVASAAGIRSLALPYSVVMLNDGAGRFTEHPTATSMLGVLGFTDIDADGDLDVIDTCLRLYTNDGAGGFTTSNAGLTVWGGDLSNRPTITQTTIAGTPATPWTETSATWAWAGAYTLGDVDSDGAVRQLV